MNKIIKRFCGVFWVGILVLLGCDLQPKIASIPDSIGEFIQNRFPALLADPDTQPEIYNSAVTDYGVYASPELYGSANIDDYVVYASVDDYVLIPENANVETEIKTEEKQIEQEIEQDYIIVPVYGGFSGGKEHQTLMSQQDIKTKSDDNIVVIAKGDTVYSLSRKYGLTVAEFAEINNLKEPYLLFVGQKLHTKPAAKVSKIPNVISEEKVKEIKAEKINVPEPIKPNATKRVDVQEITVVKGDTLYSLSRKYQIPVNDLAVMNKLSAPFTLSVGQKIKVPRLDEVKTKPAVVVKTEQKTAAGKTDTKVAKSKTEKSQEPVKQPDTKKSQSQPTKISSNPKQQLPKISSRSGSKFSWPVRGKILSGYGAKNSGLFNDGINISAPRGTDVKAAENGVVAYAGNEVKGMGNLVIMQHSDGWMTIYAHLDSMSVKRGTAVSVGQTIGKIGMTGKVDKPQLHFEIRKGTKAYDPIQYLRK